MSVPFNSAHVFIALGSWLCVEGTKCVCRQGLLAVCWRYQIRLPSRAATNGTVANSGKRGRIFCWSSFYSGHHMTPRGCWYSVKQDKYMYKEDLTLNNQKWLIYHKTKTNQSHLCYELDSITAVLLQRMTLWSFELEEKNKSYTKQDQVNRQVVPVRQCSSQPVSAWCPAHSVTLLFRMSKSSVIIFQTLSFLCTADLRLFEHSHDSRYIPPALPTQC